MSDILKEFEKRIAANKREIEEQEYALVILKRTMGASNATLISALPIKTAEAKFDDLFDVVKENKRAVIDDVRDVISNFGDKEFTVAITEAALAKVGITINAKEPKQRIASAIKQLVDKGIVTLTRKGSGSSPHIYKLNNGSDLV
uniref:Uncharacterized protein n=1 Tax=mine drainage metagenome TaxID=410659 RepID=E6QX30_9ZZZZ